MEIIIIVGIIIAIGFFYANSSKNKYPIDFQYWNKTVDAVFILNGRPVNIEKIKVSKDCFETQNHGNMDWDLKACKNNLYSFGDPECETGKWALTADIITGDMDGLTCSWLANPNSTFYKNAVMYLEDYKRLKELPYWNTRIQSIYYKIEDGDFNKSKISGTPYVKATDKCLFIDENAFDWKHFAGFVFETEEYKYTLMEKTLVKSFKCSPKDVPLNMWIFK